MNSLGAALNEALSQPWIGFVVLKSCEKKTARNGTCFFRLTFSDGATAVACNIFEDRPAFQSFASQQWRIGDHFKVQGKVSIHAQYGRQIELTQIRPIEERDFKEGYKPELLMERAPVDLEAYWQELQGFIIELKPESLQKTVAKLFEKHGENFRRAAAAKQAHHACYGGLLHHTVSMVREAKAIMGVPDFPEVNESLVIAGILLHDIGKTAEMEIYPRTEYTVLGALLGHTQLALSWLDAAACECGFEGELLLHLRHIILSHHGEYEFGAAVLPQTKEALLVHIIDNLDAKMQMAHNALKKLSDTDHVTEKLWALDNRAFRKTPDINPLIPSSSSNGQNGGATPNLFSE